VELEAGAAVLALGHLDLPAVGLGDLLDDGQAEAGAALLGREPGVEQLVSLALGDSLAVVGDVQAVVLDADRHVHRPPAVLDGVAEQVLQQLLEPARVGVDRSGVDVEVGGGRLHRVPGVVGDLCEVGPLDLVDGLALPGQRQQVVDQPLHPLQGGLDLVEVGLLALLAEQVDVALRHGQRAAQVVGDDAGELL
jgi:hypothetical protein